MATSVQSFDAIVIGAGQAGPSLAARLAAAGKKVAIVERKLFGGTCVNTGCMPTKTMVASAAAAHQVRRAASMGVDLDVGAMKVDLRKVNARRDKVIHDARAGVEKWLAGFANVTMIRGHARFVGPRELEVNGARLRADQVFINVGGRAIVPAFEGLDGVDRSRLLTNTTIFDLSEVPAHLVVVGGSYIGLEFAQMFRRFGSEVSIVEKGPRLIGREDEDVSIAIEEILRGEGIRVRTKATCIRFEARDGAIGVGVDCDHGEPVLVGSHVLLAVGREPNTGDLGLDRAGVELDGRGYVKVDDALKTTAEGVFAMGDCNGKGAFTHTAYNDYEIVASNLLDGESRKVSDRITAYALFIDPPLGRVGMSEREAREAGKAVRIGKRPMTRVGRAVEKGETQGFMKVVIDDADDRVLGAAILGVGGDEAIHAVVNAMYAGATAKTIARSVGIHPTVAELIPTVMGEAKRDA